jgi:hypothetical protein
MAWDAGGLKSRLGATAVAAKSAGADWQRGYKGCRFHERFGLGVARRHVDDAHIHARMGGIDRHPGRRVGVVIGGEAYGVKIRSDGNSSCPQRHVLHQSERCRRRPLCALGDRPACLL